MAHTEQDTWAFPDPMTTDPRERRAQRLLEIIPGVLTWTTIIGMFVFSFFAPLYVAIFIIAFDLYWIHRTFFVMTYMRRARAKMELWEQVDWQERAAEIGNLAEYEQKVAQRIVRARHDLTQTRMPRERKALRRHIKAEEELLQKMKMFHPEEIMDWRSVYHVVMLPTATETADNIRPALTSIAQSAYPKDRIIILLATEAREDEERREEKIRILTEEFGEMFYGFVVTRHEVQPGEMKCKASNTTWAVKHLEEYLAQEGIERTQVMLSNFDCESIAHPQYLAALTFHYITDPQRLQRAYQPLPFYNNNIWDTNAFVRVLMTSSSFWHMFQSTRQGMVTFSSHTEPLETIKKLNYWPLNMISEDSIIYWKGFSYFHGNYKITPIYLPISMDAVLAETYGKTLINQYKQKRRWAYGVENFAPTMRAIWPDKKIALRDKLRVTFQLLEGAHSWATASLILMLLGWLPLILGSEQFNQSVIAHNLPFVTRTLMTLAMLGLVFCMVASLRLLPPRPAHHPRRRWINMTVQWIVSPFFAPLLALPAIDSQTRILLKKYFTEFWVTDKVIHRK